MAVEAAIIILLTLTVTSQGSRDGDLLHAACEEACQKWEDLRHQCFQENCQSAVSQGEDLFPCFLTCWKLSRPCLSSCADNFWENYSSCGRQCLGRTRRKKWQCRRACAVNRFEAVRKNLVVPRIPRIKVKVDKPIAFLYT